MTSSFLHQHFVLAHRVSQSLCNDRCQNILYKSVFEHFIELPKIAALLLASKSFQNSSFGANFLVNFVVDKGSIDLLESVLSPSSCFSLQFAPSLNIAQSYFDSEKIKRSVFNFVRELVNTKYLGLSLRSLMLASVKVEVVSLFFGISTSNAWPQLQDLTVHYCSLNDSGMENISKTALQLRTLSFLVRSDVKDSELEHVAKLSNITSLDLSGCHKLITDASLEHVSKLSRLTFLDLSGCRITDAGLAHISKLPNITSLNLGCCDKITDAGLARISGLSSITSLNLGCCYQITDVGLEHLSKLSGITTLILWDCQNITDQAKNNFKGAFPKCDLTD